MWITNTALSLEAVQTPSAKELHTQGKTLIGHCSEVLVQRKEILGELSPYLVVDGYFAKASFVDAITGQTTLEVISKLRSDADLKYLYKDKQEKRRGAPRKFDGRLISGT